MHPDEYEELHFSWQTPLQIAYEHGRQLVGSNKFEYEDLELLASGRWAVMYEYVTYCPFTDAIIGSKYGLHSDHDSQAQADAEAAKVAEQYYQSECSLHVFGPDKR